jgi:hypothetical protein
VLCHGRHDVDGEPVGLREVDRHEIDPLSIRFDTKATLRGEPIQLRDDQRGAVQPAEF